jgi:hypothetical protein
MPVQSTTVQNVTQPLIVKTPPMLQQRMDAVVSMAHAIEALTKALVNTGVEIRIEGCSIHGAVTDISVKTEE